MKTTRLTNFLLTLSSAYDINLGVNFEPTELLDCQAMRKIISPIIALFISTCCIAQIDVSINGHIFDDDTKQPMSYVNIGFINEHIGTVSNDEGLFILSFNSKKVSPNSILQMSSIGYKSIKMKASEFYAYIVKNDKFYLKPETYGLNEVVIKNEKRKIRTLGSFKVDDRTVGYWLNEEALGGEIAMKFPITNPNTQLHELKFYVNKNNSGRFKIRVNVYDYKNGIPGENLLNQNILHEVTTRSGAEIINLEPYNILVHDDVVVSIELIKVIGSFIDFEIAGSYYKTHSFTKNLSFDQWKPFQNLGMAMKLSTSYPNDKGKILVKKRVQPERMTIYWDASFAMTDTTRALEKELELLKKYLKGLDNMEVEVIKFSAAPFERKVFSLKETSVNDLITYLENTYYYGVSNFDNILKDNSFNADVALLFSNGDTILEPLSQGIYLPALCINSISTANHKALQTASFYADGYYVNLSQLTVKEGLTALRTEQNDNQSYEEEYIANNKLHGIVLSDSVAISGASVRVKNTLKEVITNAKGEYKIQANADDVLIITAPGMLPSTVYVSGNNTQDLEIKPDATVLDEVLLYGKSTKQQNVVMTGYGAKSEDAVGYQIDELTGDDIKTQHITYDQIIAKLPGVIISGIGERKRYSFIRNMGSSALQDTNPIIVIDNIIYIQENGLDKLPPIDFQTVKRVQALKSVASSNRYGILAAYGAIVITTESSEPNEIVVRETPSILATDNDYLNDAVSIADIYTKPTYINQIENASTFEVAKSIFETQQKTNASNIDFYFSNANYFTRWDNNFATTIGSQIAVIAPENIKALRTLAFNFEQLDAHNSAKHLYERILEIQPNQAQSYRDLAQSYENNDQYQEALDLYKRMLSNTITDVNFTSVQEVLANDLMHLLSFHRSKLDVTNIPSDYLTAKFKLDRRIVFEWNDTNTEFEVQFVNPKKKYFEWRNTLLENKETFIEQAKNGSTIKEFIIDDAESGVWQINIKAISEPNTHNPTYLKYTVYENFGLTNESKKVKVITLNNTQEKIILDTFNYQKTSIN